MPTKKFDVIPLTGALGAEVHGVHLAELTDQEWLTLRRLWLEHLVLFFPDQHLTPDQHIAIARRFGDDVEIHPFLDKLHADHPEIVVLDSETTGAADTFHTDNTFSPTPSMASLLNMVICPELGGDTIWTNQYLAYDALAPAMQSFIDGLTATHSAASYHNPDLAASHPVVRVHPETGRKSLFVNRFFTEHINELSQRESDAVLRVLYEVSEQPFLQCRYRWTEGTVGVWDNRCTQHYAVGDYSGRRRIQRVTVIGDAPIGPEGQWDYLDDKHRRRVSSMPRPVAEGANSVTAVASST